MVFSINALQSETTAIGVRRSNQPGDRSSRADVDRVCERDGRSIEFNEPNESG